LIEYRTADGEFQTRYEILRSVFICTTRGVNSFEEGMEFCRAVAKKYSDATHNCYAINALDGQKFSDDGEPQGTGGQPIMQVIKNKGLVNVACVVTRYFGGIKLGAGGLCGAYTKSAAECLDVAKVVTKKLSCEAELRLDYNEYAVFNALAKNRGYIVTNTDYHDFVDTTFVFPVGKKEEVEEEVKRLTSGKKQLKILRETFFAYP